MIREFAAGAALLGRGYGYWRRRPGLMATGLIPAGLVAIVLLAGLATLGGFLPQIVDQVSPFADGWSPLWATVIRVTIGTALLGGAITLVAVSFTALTLLVGDLFYARIWRAVERDSGDADIDVRYGFWRGVGDAFSLLARGAAVALAALLLGLIPGVGGILSAVFAVTCTGWLLADELTSRALTARGLTGPDRRALRRGHRARMLGFGVATQLCFLVPLGAVVTMPAAVAGATLLA
ncbi:MAG TPA: EI24 domain-containing protein, partial [Microbacterium sp.]|nr:EI24 domain-containing protein [Microbacterium sp.]